MRYINADNLVEHKFTRESAKSSDYMRGWNDAIDAIVDNEPTVDPKTFFDYVSRSKSKDNMLLGVCPACEYKKVVEQSVGNDIDLPHLLAIAASAGYDAAMEKKTADEEDEE